MFLGLEIDIKKVEDSKRVRKFNFYDFAFSCESNLLSDCEGNLAINRVAILLHDISIYLPRSSIELTARPSPRQSKSKKLDSKHLKKVLIGAR